jgi:hypothetical protein
MAIWPKKFWFGNHGERSQRAHGAGLHRLHAAVANEIERSRTFSVFILLTWLPRGNIRHN